MNLFRDYVRCFFGFERKTLINNLLLTVLSALMESVSLLMLVPLLGLAGLMSQGDLPMWFEQIKSGMSQYPFQLGLFEVLVIFVSLVSIRSVITMKLCRSSHQLRLGFTDRLRNQLYQALTLARWDYFSTHHSADFSHVLTSDIQRVGQGTFFLLQLVTSAVMTVGYLVVATQISTTGTFMALLSGVVLWWILRSYNRHASNSGQRLSGANRTLHTQLQEHLSTMKWVKVHGEHLYSIHHFDRQLSQLRDEMTEFNDIHSSVQLIYRISGAVILGLLAYISLTWLELPGAHLLVLIAIFARLLPMLSQVQGGYQQLLHMLPAFASWQTLVTECRSHQEVVMTISSENIPPLEIDIVLDQVEYAHPEIAFPLVIDRLTIPANKITAIIGPSGAGKSTLLDVICGLLPPQRGSIKVDGRVLDGNTLAGWRKQLAYVTQESVIFDGTVRENLTWNDQKSRDDELWQALHTAAADFVTRLPQGLDTRLGERGVRLSGGERQRIALARALLRRPRLLILDEATSALDQENEQVIKHALRTLRGKLTVLIVAHRKETIEDADQVVALFEGRIAI